MKKVITTDNFDEVIIYNAMLEDDNGTDIYEGIVIEVPSDDIYIEMSGYQDIDEMSDDEIDEMIFNYK